MRMQMITPLFQRLPVSYIAWCIKCYCTHYFIPSSNDVISHPILFFFRGGRTSDKENQRGIHYRSCILTRYMYLCYIFIFVQFKMEEIQRQFSFFWTKVQIQTARGSLSGLLYTGQHLPVT